MRTNLRVSFQGSAVSPALRADVAEHVATLERYHGRIVSCHVVVKAPDRRRHRTGGLYEVTVHLGLPGGKSVDIDRTPTLDERFADPRFAVADSFRRARRRLQDRIRVRRGDVKNHREREAAD